MPHAAPLTSSDIVPFLLEKRLVTLQQVVDAGIAVEEASQRNRNFKVTTTDDGPNYLVKCGVGSERTLTVANEALAYQLLQSISSSVGTPSPIPRYYLYDEEVRALVIELIGAVESFRDYHVRTRRFPSRIAASLGEAVGKVHTCSTRVVQDSRAGDRGAAPWTLAKIHLPEVAVLREISLANLELIKVVQRFEEYCDLLDVLRERWASTCLIHGDIKWDNCLVSRERTGRKQVYLVDWELAAMGDPAWDSGTVFAEYLAFWVFSMPVGADRSAEDLIRSTQWPLEKMHPAMRAFWRGYAGQTAEIGGPDLTRSVQYAGARLIQIAFEHLQSGMSLTAHAVLLLQLSFNMLKGPTEAAKHLLGLGAETSRPVGAAA